jgi:hypothetical protein
MDWRLTARETETILSPTGSFQGGTENKSDIWNAAVKAYRGGSVI